MNVRRSRLLRCAIAAAALPAFGPARGADLAPVAGEIGFRLGWRDVELCAEPPARLRRVPTRRSDYAQYLAIPLGSGTNNVIGGCLDESRGAGTGYDLLYLDANNNGDLTDDPVLHPQLEQRSRLTLLRVPPVNVQIEYADGSRRALPVRIEVRAWRRGGAKTLVWSVAAHVLQHLEGRVPAGARTNLLVGLYDCSRTPVEANGCFDDYGVDRLRLDLDGDGTLDPRTEEFPLSRVIRLDGALWSLEMDAAGRRLALSPCALPTGRVAFAPSFMASSAACSGAVELASAQGFAFVQALPQGEAVALPAADYRVRDGRIRTADATGQLWEAEFQVEGIFPVARDAETRIQFGAPFTVETAVEGEPRIGAETCVAMRLIGAGGEVYDNVARIKTRMEPALSILDAEDVVVLHEKLEWG